MKLKQKIFKLTAIALAVHAIGSAQQVAKNTIVVNSGNGGFGPNVIAYDPVADSTTSLGSIGTAFIQDIVIKDHYAYVAATDSIIKYNLANNTRVAGAEFGSTSTGSLLVHGDYLFVGNQFNPTAENLEVFDINTMNKIKGFSEVTAEVPGMEVMNDTLYVLQNIKHTVDAGFPGYYLDSLGYVAKISLDDLEYQGDINFDPITTNNFSRVFANDGKLHMFGTHQQGTTTHHSYTHEVETQTNTASVFPYSINLTYGTQARKKNNILYFKFNGGIGSYDLDTETVLNPLLIDASIMAFDLDVVNDLFYVTSGDYATTAAGTIYDMSGNSVGSFDVGEGYAPEAVAVDYNWLPDAQVDYSFVIQSQIYEQDNKGNDSDMDESVYGMLFTIEQDAVHGTTFPVFGDHILYEADDVYIGLDSAKYRICDVYGDCDDTWVYYEVTEPYSIDIVDFEDFDLPAESFYNGSDGHGGFVSDGAFFGNNYNPSWQSWSGFSYSNTTDTETEGFTNQYSAYTGTGALSTTTYAVANGEQNEFIVGSNNNMFMFGLFITNSTYTALSMKNGDAFAKKFGGETGNDKDSLMVRFTGINLAGEETGSVDFYLADYTSDNNDEDYIVDTWEWVDFIGLGSYVKVKTEMISSDNSPWGMNTPAYFCVDLINYWDISVEEHKSNNTLQMFPNPTSGQLQINLSKSFSGTIDVMDAQGRLVHRQAWSGLQNQLSLAHLKTGMYNVRLYNAKMQHTGKFLKY